MVSKASSYFFMILAVMVGIFIIKWAAGKFNIPVVSTLAEGV
jgi:hypothetical protein